MAVKCKDVVNFMEKWAPAYLAEEWDNVGLIIGDEGKTVNRILVCLDITSSVVEYAENENVDMIITHHPLLFRPIKRLCGSNWKEKLIARLIKKDICVYSAHTNLDYAEEGVNWQLAQAIGLTEIRNLKTVKEEKIYKVAVFVPYESLDAVREAMGKEGAGWIGRYSNCFFMAEGTGTFMPLEGTNPYIGTQGVLEKVKEYRLESVVPESKLKGVIEAMIKAHPYEEVAYDIYPLKIKGRGFGYGKIGVVNPSLSLQEFASNVKKALNADYVRVIGKSKEDIKKAAVFSGSLDEDILGSIPSDVDVLVTGDIKYHIAIEIAEMGMCVIDAGHFNTENVIVPAIINKIKSKFTDINITGIETKLDPFIYY